MSDLYVYAAASGASLLGAGVPTLAVVLTRAWYSGLIEDRDAQADKVASALVEEIRTECDEVTVERAEHRVAAWRQARSGGRPQSTGRHAR